jgi:FMNH2-dependent dimethyl sulfone monooxygenase
MHGDEPAVIAAKIADMRARRDRLGLKPMIYGMAAYAVVRDSAREAEAEVARITDMGDRPPPGFDNFEQWLSGTQLERELKIREYSVSNRGLRPGLVGTPEHVAGRIADFEAAGLDLLLLQMSPQMEEMERFSAQVIPAGLRRAA